MAVVSGNSFRMGRFVLATFVLAVVLTTAVEMLAPERRIGAAQAAAEVAVRVVPRLAPSAESIRKRVLSTENLRAVAARLRGEEFDPSAPPDDADSALFQRWRKLLVVEVQPTPDPERRRIRFLATVGGRPGETAALVETVAAQYAGDLAAQRWYAAVDRLRAAEQTVDDALDDYLNGLPGGATASRRVSTVDRNLARRVPAPLPQVEAAPLTPTPQAAERELHRLTQLRATLLETMQPAHPQIQALDARLNVLQMAGAGTHIRRLSADEDSLSLPTFDDPPPVVGPQPRGAGNPAAFERLQAARASARACLNELLEPAAAEFPVVSTAVNGLNLWELRPFWHVVAVGLALTLGAAVAWPRRAVVREAAEPATAAGQTIASSAIAPTPPLAADEARRPTAPPRPSEPINAAIAPEYDVLRTVDEAAEASGAQVLGVLVRRRERGLR